MGFSQIKRKVGSFIIYCLGIPQRSIARESKSAHGNVVRIVNYHDITDDQASSFERQLRWLRKHYELISFEQFCEFYKGSLALEKEGLLLTFDDGLLGNYTNLLPILIRERIPAMFFVCPDLFGDGKHMSEEQIKECLITGLIAIGSHTSSHRTMEAGQTQATYFHEITESKKLLETRFKEACPSFCWPLGEDHMYSVEAMEEFIRAGYVYGFCTYSAPIFPGNPNKAILPRTNLQTQWSIPEIAFQLSPRHDRKFLGKRHIIETNYEKAFDTLSQTAD